MRDAALIKTGFVGAVVAAICFATPALVLARGAVGLSAWLVWADYALPAALAAFVLRACYEFHRRRSAADGLYCETSGAAPGAAISAGRYP